MTTRHAFRVVRCLALASPFIVSPVLGATRTVGPSGMYPKPCAAITAASDGDTVEIDASGKYDGDVCQISKNGLTLRGVNGRPTIDAAGQSSGGKAIWVISGDDTTVENIAFTGAAVADMNGAGIRQEGANLTVRSCTFRDNQDGILAGDNANSTVLIEQSEFDHNGAGDGYSHNLYINHVKKFTFQYNWSHRASVGHLLKSRATETYVLYNRLTGESDGTESYEIDIPNGGKTYVIGNLVEQGANTGNPAMLAYQEEGTTATNPSDALFVVNNTFVNDRGSGTFVLVDKSVMTPAVLTNNVFTGGGTVCTQMKPVESGSYTGTSPGFVDAKDYDYHLVDGSPCIDKGVAAGSDGSSSLAPVRQYVQPASSEARGMVGALDIGAYEYGTPSADAGAAVGSGGASDTGGSGGNTSARGGSSGTVVAGGVPTTTTGNGGESVSSGGASGHAGSAAGGESSANSGDEPDASTSMRNPSSSSSCSCRMSDDSPRGAPWSYGVVTVLALLLRRRSSRLVAKLRAL